MLIYVNELSLPVKIQAQPILFHFQKLLPVSYLPQIPWISKTCRLDLFIAFECFTLLTNRKQEAASESERQF